MARPKSQAHPKAAAQRTAQHKPSWTPQKSGKKKPLREAKKTASIDRARSSRPAFPIAGVGASAGGLEALEELFGAMPMNTGIGFVVIMHHHPDSPSLLRELLSRKTRLSVVEATDQMRVEPNRVHICPPGALLALLHGRLERMEDSSKDSRLLPIDYFFRSLAQDQKAGAIGIVLSGTGTDGTQGVRAIKAEDGVVLVQAVKSAQYPGMPSSAIATGVADQVLPPAAMPGCLTAYARGHIQTAALTPEDSSPPSATMQKILVLLRARTGNDFSHYKVSTIRRRIERRMNLHRIKAMSSYLHYVQANAKELDILLKELLIRVTRFFRDPEGFDALAHTTLPELLKSRPDPYTFRAWVPGCSTGEEVFTLSMLLRECADQIKRPLQFQIFGTDLDGEAVTYARSAQYPAAITADVSARRLERFFVREDGNYRVVKELRDMTIFATQNVIQDPPFTRLDLISCRNLLIYLNAGLQKRLLPVFHYALKPGGLLVLGPSETIGSFTDLFESVDRKWKIFRRKETQTVRLPTLEFQAEAVRSRAAAHLPARRLPAKDARIVTAIERLLLTRFAPASVAVNDRGDIVYIHGRTGVFLEPSSGQPRLNILEMAREGLRLELASALREAAAGVPEVARPGVRVRTNGDFTTMDLKVSRLREPEPVRGLLLVTLQPQVVQPVAVPLPRRAVGLTESNRTRELERELQDTKESLQTTIEELETANEDLKCTNEELQSTNEELQSTNEELETSREEMQSLNEELTTVNTELESKVEGLSRANDDMQNLLNSTEIATVFLDSDLRIKRYTEQARRLISLIPGDVGRPLGDLTSGLVYDSLVADCQEVLDKLIFKEAEVRAKDGHWYLMRIFPYRTSENVIDGVVLTFVDINKVREVKRHLHRMSKVFLYGQDPMMILDLEGRILDANEEAARTYGWTREELLGKPVEILVPKDSQALIKELLHLCRTGENIKNADCLRITKAGQMLHGLTNFSLLTDERGEPEVISMVTKHVKD